MALWKLNRRPRKILLCRYLAKVRWLKIHPPMLSDQACTPRKAGHFAPVLWGVGHDRSEGLNRHIEYKHQHTIHIISLPCLNWGDSSKVCMDTSVVFPSATAPSWYTDLLVNEDEEVSKECLHWNGLSNSVLSFAHGIASEDLGRPNAWRHHESETHVQREDAEDVLQATHWMHSMTAHTRGILWKMIEPRSRGWLCCFRKQTLSNFVSSKRWKSLSLPKRLTQRCLPRLQRVISLAPQSHLPTTGSETFPGTTSRQLNQFSMMMMRKLSLDPKPDAINGPWCKIWRTWPWLCCVNTSSATFPVQWDSSFCGRMVEKYWRWRHLSESG